LINLDGAKSNPNQMYTYLTLTNHVIPKNSGILWGGMGYGYNQAFTSKVGQQYWGLESTFAGAIPDQLGRCCVHKDGTFKDQDKCTREEENEMWRIMSSNFASKLTGVVSVFLDGNREFVVTVESIFSQYELPVIDRKETTVTELDFYLITYRSKEVKENCLYSNVYKTESTVQAITLHTELNNSCQQFFIVNQAIAYPVIDPATVNNLMTLMKSKTGITNPVYV